MSVVVRASSTPSTSSNASAVAGFTANAPTGVADSEYLLLPINIQIAGTVNTPAGWTLLVDTGLQGANDRLLIFGRVWHTGDATSWAITFTVSTAYGAICAGYTGVDSSAPFGVPVNTNVSVSSTTLNVGSMTTTRNGSMGLTFAGVTSNSTTFTATPAGYSEWAVVGGKRLDICDKAYPVSGTSTGALSYTTSAGVQGWTVNVELLAPATGTTAPPPVRRFPRALLVR